MAMRAFDFARLCLEFLPHDSQGFVDDGLRDDNVEGAVKTCFKQFQRPTAEDQALTQTFESKTTAIYLARDSWTALTTI